MKYVSRVGKKTTPLLLLENLPLLETLLPLEMMMTAGRQVPSLDLNISYLNISDLNFSFEKLFFSRRGLI